MNRRVFASVLFCMLLLAADAESLDFSYNYSASKPTGYGKGKAETVDVAIRLSDSGLVGKKVVSLQMPITYNFFE